LTLGIAPRRAKPRWLTLLIAVVAVTLISSAVALAGAIGTAAGFEDDDGNLAVTSTFDWNGFSPTTWTGTAPYRQSDKVASGWTFKGIEDADAVTSDTAFAGGTKQDQNCPSVIGNKAPNKDDLKRIYLATKVVNGHTYLELAWVRIPQNTTSPSAHIGFEFNKGSTPCGAGSDGLVQRSAGDMLIVYDFEGGTTDTPTITVRRWVLTGACEVGNSTAPCWGPAQNLTLSGFAEAKVNTTTTALDTIGPAGASPGVTLGISEFGEAGIDLTAAQIFAAGSCESFGKAFGVSRSSGNSGTAQMKDLVGPGNFTLANCGTVIIRKVTSPSGDATTSFSYTTNVTTNPATTTSPFSLKDGESNTIPNVVTGSGKTVTEGDPSPLYALTGIDCSASSVPAVNISTNTGTRTVTFSIAGGETLDCTYTNTKQTGALTILKNSSKGGAVANAGAVFSYGSSSVTDNGTGDEDAATGSVCVSGLVAGNYTVNETSPPSGYGDAPASEDDQVVAVVAGTNCTDNLPGAGATATFTNPPLSDIQVRFRDGGSGETSITSMTCDNSTGTSSTTGTANWDDTLTVSGVEAPTTIVCTIVIDP
jgi:hypothetical protein